jgi:hypothetical protein
MSSLGPFPCALTLALALADFLAVVADGAGAAEAGRAGSALGGKTVGSRSPQPGTSSRLYQPTILITGV